MSRTVSDTLGQEFEEYVTLSQRGQQTGGIACGGTGSAVASPGALSTEAFQVQFYFIKAIKSVWKEKATEC